ncbi:cardiolipin synthase [Lysinibacter cavernae]|uniref:Cardiolipin synthase n=1 Tax=Lysinibacter cavernae TaxID=1640652 RepID=A0A7X5R285_9MICO|nr:cardiolipin synthase [Lysinibacter cavernae]NIH54271.1 cardiolipin synthase [Lysinibacter cavernae]
MDFLLGAVGDSPFSFWLAVALFVIDFSVRVIAIIVVPRNRRPTSGMAWLLAIFFIPYVGIILFLIIGSRRLPRSRRRKQDEINRLITEATTGSDRLSDQRHAPPWLASIATLGRNLGALPLTGGNGATLFTEYKETINSMADAVRSAERYVHVQFYILAYDPTTEVFFEAMKDAVDRGIPVRVLLDHVASLRSPGYKRTRQKLEDIGVEYALMLPVRPFRGEYQRPDLRNHRKILVVDGTVGFMGSQNLIDSSYNKRSNRRRGLHWQDLMVRLEGPIVSGLNAIFLGDWFSETDEVLVNWVSDIQHAEHVNNLDCQAVPSGPGFAGENNLQMFLALLYNASNRISITSPYFVPDESIMYAIKAATNRGVAVELFVSEVGDQAVVYHAQRSYYEDLLKAGVRIFMYRPPYILHSKHFSIDDRVAVVGSSNMDMRSFSLNMEVSMMVHGKSFVDDLRLVEDGYRANSRELTLEEWRKQPIRSTMLDNLARLTSALQ